MEVNDGDNWREQLPPEGRQRVINKIMDTLMIHLPVHSPEGIGELQTIAVRFEEKIYTTATSQSDYLRKISLKMLSLETKASQTAPINSNMSNGVGPNQNSTVPASLLIQPQDSNQGQSFIMPLEASVGSGSAVVDTVDWRNQLQPEARQRIVNKIMDTLKGHLTVSVPEGFAELQGIAVRFEERIYNTATSQSDYLRKISLKMMSMETKTQQTAPSDVKAVSEMLLSLLI